MTGSATLNGINGATITVYSIKPDGSNDKQIGTGTAGTDGTFSIKLDALPTTVFRVCASGGNYNDEATGAALANAVGQLCALVPGGTGNVNISPLTALVNALSVGLLKTTAGQTVDAAMTKAEALLQQFFALNKPAFMTQPVFTAPAAGGTPGDAYTAGVLLGAYSQLEKNDRAGCGMNKTPQDTLNALLLDIDDGVFDGKMLDPNDPTKTVPVMACGGTKTLPEFVGTNDLLAALNAFANTTLGQTMQVAQNTATTQNINNGVQNSAATPVALKGAPSQGLIAINTASNLAYVPVTAPDPQGNAQVAVVDLTPNAAKPVVGTISLPGSATVFGTNLDTGTGRVYAAATTTGTSNVAVYVIDTTDNNKIINTIDAPGITQTGRFGGIVVDPAVNQVLVAGTDTVGLIDISKDPAVFDAASVVSLDGTDSICLNATTQKLFVSTDGTLYVIDIPATPPTVPLVASNFVNNNFGTTDGCGFDATTNMLVISPEFEDRVNVFNFGQLNAGETAAPNVNVAGLGNSSPVGEGPGGQATVNPVTHQALVADENGVDLRLVQLPTAPISATGGDPNNPGAPDNNGQPGSNTTADAASAYTIATTAIPGVNGNTITLQGDPSSITADPVSNYAYAIGNDDNGDQFLVGVDLSQPILGASPTAVDGNNQPLRWTPTTQIIPLP